METVHSSLVIAHGIVEYLELLEEFGSDVGGGAPQQPQLWITTHTHCYKAGASAVALTAGATHCWEVESEQHQFGESALRGDVRLHRTQTLHTHTHRGRRREIVYTHHDKPHVPERAVS